METEISVTREEPDFDLSKIEYVKGFDDPCADVVLVSSDKKALRIHDYYLKAARRVQSNRRGTENANLLTLSLTYRSPCYSPFFREMLEAGTKGGPIGLDEKSPVLEYIMSKVVGRRPPQSLLMSVAFESPHDYDCSPNAVDGLIHMHSVTEKYILGEVSAFILERIAHYASSDPPTALSFALNLEAPHEAIIRAALTHFEDRMLPRFHNVFDHLVITSRVPQQGYCLRYYTPAANGLSRDYVRRLGVDGYYAYVRALKAGSTGEDSWDWKLVADSFIKHLDIPTEE